MKNKMSLKIKNNEKDLFSKMLKKKGINAESNLLKNYKVNGNTVITARNQKGAESIQKILNNSKNSFENDNMIKLKFVA